MSARFKLDKEEGLKILKVFLWSLGSAVLTALLALLATAQFPPEWVWLVPLLNTVGVAVKKWLEEKK